MFETMPDYEFTLRNIMSDSTEYYDVNVPAHTTVAKFLQDVLESDLRGCIGIETERWQDIFGSPYLLYKGNEIVEDSGLDALSHRLVKRASAFGGYGVMNYKLELFAEEDV